MTAKKKAAAKAPAKPDDYVSYGFSAALGAAVPEIGALLKQASAGGWDVQRFTDALENTGWWKSNSDTAKQQIALQQQDPAQYAQQVKAAQAHVQQAAAAMGVTLTSAQMQNQATIDLWQGLDDATLQQDLGRLYTGSAPAAGGGTSVSLTAQINQLSAQYGVPVTKSWVNSEVQAGLSAGTGAEGAQAALKQMASQVYPGLAAQLAAGQTTEQIAQPYIALMSQTLELPETAISLSDPTIQRALQGSVTAAGGSGGSGGGGGAGGAHTPTQQAGGPPAIGVAGGGSMTAPTDSSRGTVTGGAPKAGLLGVPKTTSSGAAGIPQTVTLGDFANQLRADPRWDKTANAVASAYSMVHNLGTQWGFAS